MHKKTVWNKKIMLFLSISLVIALIDQLSKLLVVNSIPLNSKISVFPGFNLIHIQNTGAGFSLFEGFTPYLAWISVIVIGIIIYYYPRIEKNKFVYYLCSFILGGTLGNLIDRFRLGYVTDFFDFYFKNYHYATFNIADAFISVSAVILIIYLWKKD